MSDKTLATFRIQGDKWDRFKEKTGNASKVLTEFIDAYLAGLIDTSSWEALRSSENLDEAITARLEILEKGIDERIEKEIAALRREFQPALDALPERSALRRN